jgi:hypothetical protein
MIALNNDDAAGDGEGVLLTHDAERPTSSA